MKIAIIGNCQAAALQTLLHRYYNDAQTISLPPIFDLSAMASRHIQNYILDADYVFAQRVSDDFPISYLRPDNLRAELGKNVIVWPNIYFDGYSPGVRYLYQGTGQKITGPLSDYHFQQILCGWQAGCTAEETWSSFKSEDGWEYLPDDPAGHSLLNLQEREMQCDLAISDYIADHFQSSKQFHSMNHPGNDVLLEMLYRLMNAAGLDMVTPTPPGQTFELLSEIDLPPLPYAKARYGFPFGQFETFGGTAIGLESGVWTALPQKRLYGGAQLIEAFFQVYDSMETAYPYSVSGYD